MTGLVLDEQRIPAVLDQVRDIRAAQRMEVQPGREPERGPARSEPVIDLVHADPRRPLGGPQRRVTVGPLQRPDLTRPLSQHLSHPGPDRQHAAPPRREAFHRLNAASHPEQPDRLLVAAQRRGPQPADRPQVGEPLIGQLRRPRPRERLRMRGERAHRPLPRSDRSGR